jgi:hypothetical protein
MRSVCTVITKFDFNSPVSSPLASFSVGSLQPANVIISLQEMQLYVRVINTVNCTVLQKQTFYLLGRGQRARHCQGCKQRAIQIKPVDGAATEYRRFAVIV